MNPRNTFKLQAGKGTKSEQGFPFPLHIGPAGPVPGGMGLLGYQNDLSSWPHNKCTATKLCMTQTPTPQHGAHQQYRDGSDPKWPKKGRPLPGEAARPREGRGSRPGLSADPRPPKSRDSEARELRGKLGVHLVPH